MTIASKLIVAAAMVTGAMSFGTATAKPTLHFTAHERRACRSEAITYCAHTYPNKRALVNCLQAHKSSLGGACKRVLKNGVSERASLSH